MTFRRNYAVVLLPLLILTLAPRALAQCVSLTTLGAASTQNFNTLSNTAGSTTNNLTITGWFLTETGLGARDNEQYAVDTGGSNTGDTYSYGAAGNTERALGGLQSGTLIPVIGACYTNNTGATITALDVAYTGEQWRIGNTAAARDDRLDFQYSLNATDLATGAWTDVNALDFTNPIKTIGVAGALDGNNAANRTAISQSIPSLAIANGATFWIRWNDLNASGADDGLAVDDFSLTPQGGIPTPVLNISDVTLAEGDPPGTTTFTFNVTLTIPAGPGGVTFDIATSDGTAQDDTPATEDNDYVAQSLTGQNIPAGSTGPYNFNVTVNRDTVPEPNETFFVNVSNITGANAGDVQGQGTINNDDVSLTPIHDVQGPGASSPVVGSSVTIRGIVTGVKSNGFFVQEEDAEVDADPATSEGIFVFTSAAPPAAAAFTAQVQVTGTVAEFVPTADPQQPPVTELTSPTVVQLQPAGQPLPTAVNLTATFPDPAGPHDQLERLEGMRVNVASITVSGPSDGTINEANNTGTSNGRFHGVITGVARPFREPGVQAPDTVPVGTIPPIPRWDFNPERLRIESATINAQPILTVKSGDVVAPVRGVVDYGFRGYAIYPDGTLGTPVVTPGTLPTTVTTPTGQEFTVASFNIFHFYNTTDDAGSDVILTAGAYNDRLNKASIAIRNNLKFPDIIGLQEVENLGVLNDLATKINNDAVAASQPNPMYVAYLSEGNDVGGIDVGFLVKTAPVTGGAPRVTVNSVVQIGAATTWIDPDDGNPALLNDRPSLVLDGVINRGPGLTFPIIVINNHLRSLIGIDSNLPDGATTEGDRVRRKRQTQADQLAQYLQGRLTSNPNEHIVLVGDFNAFEFNDGYADPINTILGTPPPDNQTVVCATCPTAPNTNDGVDQVNPNLVNLVNTPPAAERYSYIHDGNAQNIDHALVSAGLVTDTTARRIEHPRINTDYPETERANAASPLRISDHDPVVAFFTSALFALADVSITKTDNVDPVNAGQNFFYTITVNNNGPDPADTVSWSDTLPAGTTFVSLSAPGGWSCTTPAVGATGTVTCSIATLAVGSAPFTLTVAVNPALASGTVLSNTATVTSATADPDGGNGSATQTTTVATSADLSLSKTDSPDPVNAGQNLTYTITLTNNGPSNAASATFSDTLPAGTTFVSLSTTGSWSCTTPAVGATGTVSCTNSSFLVTADFFTLVVNVDAGVAAGTVLSNTATLASSTSDPNGTNDSATATTTVGTSADVSITKTDSPDPVNAGAIILYTITVTNAGPSTASTVSWSDTTPANTVFTSLSSTPPGWSCTTPSAGSAGTITCSAATFGVGSEVFTLGVEVDRATPAATVISNTATVSTATTDSNSGNNSATATTTVTTLSDIQVIKTDSPDPVTAGSNLTYTINVGNAGPSTATNVTLSDTLPAGTTFVSLTDTGSGWSCTTPAVGGTGTINCSAATLTFNTIFTLVVNVDASTPDGTVITNTALGTADTTDPDGSNNSSTATTTVGSGAADVSITKSDSPDPVTAGQNLAYTITVNNAGPSNATTVSMSDTLPAGTTFVSLSSPGGWSCTTPAVGATGTVTCSIATMAVTNAVFTLTVNVDDAQTANLSNTATVSSATTDPNPGNETATALTSVITSADLQVTKTDSPDPISAGSLLTYTINVTNAGPSAAANATVTDIIPAGTVYITSTPQAGWSCSTPGVGGTGTWSCAIASFPAGGTAVFTIGVTVNASLANGTVITNTATVATTTTDPVPGNNSAIATTTVAPVTNFTATKSVAGTFVAGSTVTYTVVLTNNMGHTQGNNFANEFADILPSGLALTGATATSGTILTNLPSNIVTWNGSIPNGGTVTITITATITAGSGTISNQGNAIIDTDNDGQNETGLPTDDPSTAAASDPTVFTVIPSGSVTATKTVAGSFTPGGSITYTVVITNGMSIAQANNPGDEFVDILPSSLTLVSASATSGTALATVATNTVTWNGSLAVGASVTITINATINPSVTPGTTISNTGTVNYDNEGDGTNDDTGTTDSPAPGSGEPTTFTVGAANINGIPTLDEMALFALAAILAAVALMMMKR
ncbi:MAG TPA: endonuclease/exonuclease/phosphatase family protein [Thermoanaerobaculia bacterium]